MKNRRLLYSADVIGRILRILDENSHLKKTNLAGKAGLNHGVLMKYVNFLNTLKLINVTTSDKVESISISKAGKQMLTLLEGNGSESLNIAQPDAAANSDDYSRVMYREENGKAAGQQSYGALRKGSSLSFRGSKEKRVMIVDDDEAILMTFETFLNPYGYRVKTFSDSVSALRHFTKQPAYSLAILDIRLPHMNGLQLYQSLKAINPSLQVIFVSSLDAAQELVTLVPGASHSQIMRKPINREQFLKVVKSTLA